MRTVGRRRLLGSIPALALVPAAAARAQSLEVIAQREAAVIEAWEKTPLTVRKAVFVSRQPSGYGIYEPRPAGVFRPGEPLLVYAEPVGYGWKALDGGFYEFGFAIDFAIRTAKGEMLGGRTDFGRVVNRSRTRNQEFMLTLTLDVTGAPPGDLVLAYKLRDVTGPKVATFELPFSVGA